MFTELFFKEIETAFERQMERLGSRRSQVFACLETCSKDEAEALKCLYASMPISDAADYEAELFLRYAKHGVFLWERGPFAGKIPEKMFAGYVLHHRINDEDLTDCRRAFYERLKGEINKDSMLESIFNINYWCASQATYQTTDDRTAGPECVMRSAYGRCGEESTFVVSVLRSVGIPARQVYVPLWSHCDDNHAWVEVWCDGIWKFLGACEPEEVLNKGWFTDASSRAMMVHSRWFLPCKPEDEVVGRSGMARVLNHLNRYAHTTELEVLVVDENEQPVQDAKVTFRVLNYGEFGPIAEGRTDERGRKIIETGLGSILVTACVGDSYGEKFLDTREEKSCIVVIRPEAERNEAWKELVFRAPKDEPINRCVLTTEQAVAGKERLANAVYIRQKKEAGFYDTVRAEKALSGFAGEEREILKGILKDACGNLEEIAAFLEVDSKGEWANTLKRKLLESLRKKDYLDVTCRILVEQCQSVAPYVEKYDDDILVPYLLCPRVDNEMLRLHREFLLSQLGTEEIEAMRNNPELVWEKVCDLKTDPDLEYGNLITSVTGAFTTGYASRLSQKVISVQILRSIGIPARLNPVDRTLEYYNGQKFLPLKEEKRREVQGKEATLILKTRWEEKRTYVTDWTLARFNGEEYVTLRLLDNENGAEIGSTIPLESGQYKVLTCNRLPNGNIFAKEKLFYLKEGEQRELVLEWKEAGLDEMLEENDITDFTMRKENGERVRISELLQDKKGVFIWLDVSKEPTEHILNEIHERQEVFRKLPCHLYFVMQDQKGKEDPTFRRTRRAVPNAEILLDDFGAEMEAVARRMYLEPGRLPLIVGVDERMTGMYGVAGYNVGTADMLVKILTR